MLKRKFLTWQTEQVFPSVEPSPALLGAPNILEAMLGDPHTLGAMLGRNSILGAMSIPGAVLGAMSIPGAVLGAIAIPGAVLGAIAIGQDSLQGPRANKSPHPTSCCRERSLRRIVDLTFIYTCLSDQQKCPTRKKILDTGDTESLNRCG